MGCPPDLIVTVEELPRFNVPADFLAQFEPVSFEIEIQTPGVLGTMTFAWRKLGEENWSQYYKSISAATWTKTIGDVFSSLTFAARAYPGYLTSDTFIVDENGTVTGTGTGLTVSRYSLPLQTCQAVTSEVMNLLRNAVKPPMLTWGDDFRQHAADWVHAILRRGRGMSSTDTGMGDDNVLKAEEAAQKFFWRVGQGGKPDNVTDSSPSADGPMIQAYPVSRCLRGWGDAY